MMGVGKLAGTAQPVERCYQEIGEWCVAQRGKAGLTQQHVADLMSLSRASIANLECGRQRLLWHQVLRLQEVLSDTAITEHVKKMEDDIIAKAEAIKRRRARIGQ